MRAVTKADFARERGVDPSRVSQWLKDGRIVEIENRRIDADDAHARLNASLDQTKGIRRDGNVTSSTPELALPSAVAKPADKPGDDAAGRDDADYWKSKSRREAAEAQLSEMKALSTAGALTAAAGVKRERIATARGIRNAMLAIPDRVAPVLDPSNPARAHKLLTDEIVKALREFTAELEQRAADAAGVGQPDLAVL
jgi:hypothetical protein